MVSIASLFVLACFGAQRVHAQPLDVAVDSSFEFRCAFDPSCAIAVSDLTSEFTLASTVGEGVLGSRTSTDAAPPTAQLSGLYAYSYVLDLRNMEAVNPFAICMDAIAIEFGPTVPFDFDGDGSSEDCLVALDSLGTVGVESIVRDGNWITIDFEELVCMGGSGNPGERTIQIWFLSEHPPTIRTGEVLNPFGFPIELDSRVPSLETFFRGDCNVDDLFNIADAVFLLETLFGGGSSPTCLDACDANDDGVVDISDSISVLESLFSGGSIPAPYGDCGVDPTLDALDCVESICP